MNKRAFIKYLGLAGSSFAAGAACQKYLFPNEPSGENTTLGEEWKNKKNLNQKDLTDLPEDAEVLKNAQERIEKYRKADFNISFQNPDKTPFALKEVTLQLNKHEVDWGCSGAGSAQLLVKDDAHRKRSKHFAALFDTTTAKCYWEEHWHQPIERYRGRRIYDLFLDEIKWAESLGLKIKGHPLIWTIPKAIPRWLTKYKYEDQLKFLKEHIQSLIGIAGPAVQLWDLCNEMLWEPAFKNIAKRKWPHLDSIDHIADYISMGLEWAREVNPNAAYSLNDYGLIYTYSQEISAQQQRERYLKIVEALKQRNNLPDAIGCQSHVGGQFKLGAFEKSLQHLSKSGLPLQVTEFWAHENDFASNLPPEKLENIMAEYICNMFTVGFAEPALNHFTYWGGNQFFNDNNEPTYIYHQLHQLIKNEWTTQFKGTTDEQGKLSFNGFKGSYQILATNNKNPVLVADLTTQEENTITIF